MQIVVISPDGEDPRETRVLGALIKAGLSRYHVRKPAWTREVLAAWIFSLPRPWRRNLVLHQHHELAVPLGLGGTHERDSGPVQGGLSRSCHEIAALESCLPLYNSILFGPVFASISKPGYGPSRKFPWVELTGVLRRRSRSDARVLAVGGVTAEALPKCLELGFDGAAVLGAVWSEPDPAGAYARIRDEAARLEGERHAA
ncbi:MAG TPA: thiamine phosphate synthase [Opitutaceae bacterium]|jgi:thiamine-phosphate pyrophosphorylase